MESNGILISDVVVGIHWDFFLKNKKAFIGCDLENQAKN